MSDNMELQEFLDGLPEEIAGLKNGLLAIRESVLARPGVTETFLARPGVSYSLRWNVEDQTAGRDRPLFAMSDMVPLGGDEYMLSVCFFQDEIGDPDELGDAIPGGMYGGDGYCFDLEDEDPELVAYLSQRAAEAYESAKGA